MKEQIIKFTREGTNVVLSLDAWIPYDTTRVFPLKFACANECYAGLLTMTLRDAIGNAVRTARQDAYAAGWKDAKAKKKGKEEWQSTRL